MIVGLVACFGPANARIAAQVAGNPSASPATEANRPSIDDPILFGVRVGFKLTPLDAPPIAARRAGEATDALSVAAVGDVRGRNVADIGAGRGRHVAGLSQRVGSLGQVFATEVSRFRCDALSAVVGDGDLDNVSVFLATKTDVGLDENTVDVALLSDVYQFVQHLNGRGGQDKHAFLTSLHRAVVPGGEVVVTYVSSDQLKNEDTRQALLENTLADFTAYGFEAGRRWLVKGPHWAHLVLEFRLPEAGPASAPEYMGRTIATTMHWKGAEWLLRAEREREEAGAAMLAALGVRPGWTVTDFGCGNGYYTLQIAQQAGPEGRVFGVDIQPEMLSMLESRADAAGITNIEPILGTALDAALPKAACDLVLLADVYHEMSHPVAMLAVIRRTLKPGGRVALLEFRAEDPEVPIKRLHKMSRRQILAEMLANGFCADGSFETLPRQHLLFFRVADGG